MWPCLYPPCKTQHFNEIPSLGFQNAFLLLKLCLWRVPQPLPHTHSHKEQQCSGPINVQVLYAGLHRMHLPSGGTQAEKHLQLLYPTAKGTMAHQGVVLATISLQNPAALSHFCQVEGPRGAGPLLGLCILELEQEQSPIGAGTSVTGARCLCIPEAMCQWERCISAGALL